MPREFDRRYDIEVVDGSANMEIVPVPEEYNHWVHSVAETVGVGVQECTTVYLRAGNQIKRNELMERIHRAKTHHENSYFKHKDSLGTPVMDRILAIRPIEELSHDKVSFVLYLAQAG